ncbi:MAG: hypothetical protein Q8J78_15175 [Moraxellaceae bacterium]|nr:hypothetical protein [Moraxellaceae bacterium]
MRQSCKTNRYSLLGCLLLAFLVSAAHGEAASGPVVITEKSFKCLQDMTPVRGFFVDNLSGNLQGTLAVANSASGGVYPPGSVVQLFPNEVMVKREAGFNPVTKDWEFFELDVSPKGSVIRKRGFADVVNRFGGNCFACHVRAKPEWDMICEKKNGCEQLPIADMAVRALQKTDPRCASSDATTTERMTNWMIRVFTPL